MRNSFASPVRVPGPLRSAVIWALRKPKHGACRFRDRIGQLHVSEVNTESRHDRLSLESILAFQKVCQLVPPDVPMILESSVDEAEINEEICSALAALNPAGQLAVAGD